MLSGAFEHSAQPSEIPHQGSSALDKLLKTDSVDPVAAAKDLQIALKLHDDIYEVCRQKKVDRFSKYKVEDNLAQTAMQRIRSREGKRFPARFSIGYWKAWTETRDTLEHTSEQVKRSEEAAELLAGRRRPSKMPFKSTYKKPKKNPRDKLRGLAFGPPNAQMPSMYVQADPCGQPPVAALFEEHTNRPLPKDPTMLPKPVFVPPFKGGDIPGDEWCAVLSSP